MIKRIVRGFGIPLLFLFIYVMTSALGMFLFEPNPIILAIFVNILMIIITTIYISSTGHIRRSDETPYSIKIVVTLGVLFFVMWLYGQITGAFILSQFGDPNFQVYLDIQGIDPALTVLLSVFMAPVMEELLFRGVLQGNISRFINPWLAIVIQSLIFALIHGTRVHLFATFVLGMFVGILLELTGSMKWPILAHMGYNIVTVFFGTLTIPTALTLPIVIFAVDVVVLIVLFYLYKEVLELRKNNHLIKNISSN